MKTSGALAAVMLAALLAGCSTADQDELQPWIAEQRAQQKAQIEPIQPPKQFSPENYTQQAVTDPFSSLKLTQALKRESAQSSSNAALIAPELSRRKEPLESFPLDVMSMVGTLVKEGRPVALVKVDSLLYQVRPGNYLGQNYGRITKVSETELVMREIVQDAAGEWIERVATLQLQERSK